MAAVEQLRIQEESRSSTFSTSQAARRMSQSQIMFGKSADRVQVKCSDRCECCVNTRVFNALKPLMLTCFATGLLFRVDFGKKGIRKYCTLSHLYSLFIMLCLGANCIRYLAGFNSNDTFDISFFMKLAINSFNVECFAHFVCFYVASCSYKRLPEFFVEWERIQLLFSVPLSSVNRQAYIYTTILGVILFIVNVGCGYIMWGTQIQDISVFPMGADHPHVNILKVVNLVLFALQTVAWLVPPTFMHLVAKILSREFRGITRGIRDIGVSDVTKLKEILESTRRHHQRLCKLVGHADDIFSMQIAVTFCGSFIMVCLGMYICIYDETTGANPTIMLTIWIFWLVMGLARMLMDCISGAMLNTAVSNFWALPKTKFTGISGNKHVSGII